MEKTISYKQIEREREGQEQDGGEERVSDSFDMVLYKKTIAIERCNFDPIRYGNKYAMCQAFCYTKYVLMNYQNLFLSL